MAQERETERLFMERDEAVNAQAADFLKGLYFPSVPGLEEHLQGYLALSRISSSVLTHVRDADHLHVRIVFVQERYWKAGDYSHTGYLLYRLAPYADRSLLIYSVTYRASVRSKLSRSRS